MNEKLQSDGVVTIVIAAYQRPAEVNRALKSIYRQTYEKWQVLVVADCCSSDFLSAIDLTCERVKIVNLPVRCGNQYGPNSVGVHMADTEYIAYLNHDDQWLPDHLEIAINEIKQESSNLFLGRSAFCHWHNQLVNCQKEGRLLFSELNRPRLIWRCLTEPSYLFEPISSWVLTTAFAKKVGLWQPPDRVEVTPMNDWLKRASGLGARFSFSDKVSVLKFNLHHISDSEGPTYIQANVFADYLDAILKEPPDVIREHIKDDLELAEARSLLVRRILVDELKMTPGERDELLFYLLYVNTGTTVLERARELLPKSTVKKEAMKMLFSRTGEHITEFIEPDQLIKYMTLGERKIDV